MFAKLAASNPFVIAARIRYAGINYRNQHDMLIEMMALFSPLHLDILLFELLRYVTCTLQERLGPDGTTLTPWLINLSALLAALLARYQQLDLAAVCQYVYLTLRDTNKPHDVILLHDLLTHCLGALPRPLEASFTPEITALVRAK